MSEFSGVFDQLADALGSSGATPSATLRHARAARKRAYAARGVQAPTPLEPIVVPQVSVIPAKPPREIDRSRDHAVYAAPHRPLRPHYHSRPEDIATQRVLRRAIATASATASNASRTLPIVTIAFSITMALGTLAYALFFHLI